MKENLEADRPLATNAWWKRCLGKLVSAVNYDFCPNWNPYVFWLKHPIGWVVCGAAFSALVGFFVGPQGFVLMWAFLAFLVIAAVWPWLSMKRIECRLIFDRSRVEEDATATATVEITNKWPIPVFGLIVEGEFLLDFAEGDSIAVGLRRVPGWSVSRFDWHLKPKQRGVLPADQPVLSNGFPFGLYRSQKQINVAGQTIVWPKSCQLNGIPGLSGATFNIAGVMSDRSGSDGDVIGVRQYRQGDPLKHVHWAKTASAGQLMVQERQTCAQRPFEVLLDLTPISHQGTGSQSSYEWAIRIASSVCQQLHQHQVHLNLTCLGMSRSSRNQVSNVQGVGQVLDFLAQLPQLHTIPASDESPMAAATVAPLGGTERLVICTDQSPEQPSFQGAQRIELMTDRFTTEASEATVAPQLPVNSSQKSVTISSPQQATDDLVQGWAKGVCHGS